MPKDAPKHPVTVHIPDTVGALDTSVHDINGVPTGVSCKTCHGRGGFAELKGVPENFHEKMKVSHGTNTVFEKLYNIGSFYLLIRK